MLQVGPAPRLPLDPRAAAGPRAAVCGRRARGSDSHSGSSQSLKVSGAPFGRCWKVGLSMPLLSGGPAWTVSQAASHRPAPTVGPVHVGWRPSEAPWRGPCRQALGSRLSECSLAGFRVRVWLPWGFHGAPVSGCWGTRRGQWADPTGNTLAWTSLSLPLTVRLRGLLCRVAPAWGPSPPGCTPLLQASRDWRPRWATLLGPPRGRRVRRGLARPRAPSHPGHHAGLGLWPGARTRARSLSSRCLSPSPEGRPRARPRPRLLPPCPRSLGSGRVLPLRWLPGVPSPFSMPLEAGETEWRPRVVRVSVTARLCIRGHVGHTPPAVPGSAFVPPKQPQAWLQP